MTFEPSGFFVLRAPLLSIEAWQRWGDDADLEGQRAFIRAHLERPEIREALSLASRSLQGSLASWARDPESEDGQKVERTLVRYLSRMSTRPTPFGLFAGCGVGELGDRTEVRVPSLAAHRRHTRLDNDYLVQLTEDLLARPSVRHHVRYRPNNSLCEHGEQLRYVEPQRAGQDRTYSLVALESNEFVAIAVERAREGATAPEIARALVESDPEVDLEEAIGFVDVLIDSHILISDLEPAVTGREPIHELIDALAAIPGVDAEKSALERVRHILAGIDEIRPFVPQDDAYAEIERELETTGTSADRQHLLQVDMQLGLGRATLNERIVPELVRAATFVMQYCPQPDDVYMSEFCRRFEKRYERAEVPLLEVLDEDSGIGFGQLSAEGNDPEPMLAGVNLPRARKQAIGRMWGAFEEVLLRKLDAMVPGQIEIQVDVDDFAHVVPEALELPDACALNVTLAARSADAIDAGDYRALLHLVDGPSAVNWLGRFCHGDPTLKGHVERALRQEQALRPDAVFAEIVHLPEGRTGNVLHRPVLRDYEIPVLGRSGADAAHQLPPDDLTVTVWDGRVVLKSKRLGKEVIPRLCSAHAFPNPTNIGLYRFLGFLQTDANVVAVGSPRSAALVRAARGDGTSRAVAGSLVPQVPRARAAVRRDESRAMGGHAAAPPLARSASARQHPARRQCDADRSGQSLVGRERDLAAQARAGGQPRRGLSSAVGDLGGGTGRSADARDRAPDRALRPRDAADGCAVAAHLDRGRARASVHPGIRVAVSQALREPALM
jgi:hypothetical protein